MFFFLKLAIGNVIKHLRDSIAILTVVIVCVFFMEFMVGYMDGFIMEMENDALLQSGHITVYNKDFRDSLDFKPVDMNMEYTKESLGRILAVENVLDVRPEINFGVLANTEFDSKESEVMAIDPLIKSLAYEKRKETLKDGRFVEKDGEIVIGVKMAKTLKAGLGGRIIMLTTDQYGSINAVEGTVVGIFRNYSPSEEGGLIICTLPMAQRLLAIEGRVTEMIVTIDDYRKARQAAEKINEKLPKGVIASPWEEDQPVMVPMLEMADVSLGLMMGIFIFVAGMGISNSFLMNIMGRLPEFGVLRAMGLGGRQMFAMIMAESFTLGVIGSVIGMIPGSLLVWYFQVNPINYESMGEVFDTYEGLSSQIGMAFTVQSAVMVLVTGVLVAVAASIYPALVATAKKPVEILRVTQ